MKRLFLLTLVLVMAISLCGCAGKSQTNAQSTSETQNIVSVDAETLLENDSHVDYDEWKEYEFDDEGIVIGETVFRANKDGVVYLVLHYSMDDPTEAYEYDETKTSSETQITWKNGNTTKSFTAGELINKY